MPPSDKHTTPSDAATPTSASDTLVKRKEDHIDLVLRQRDAAPSAHPFDAVRLKHHALPDMDLSDVDLEAQFLGFTLKRPFLISSMTGGPARAEAINRHLAEAASALGVALGVGSQRVALASGARSGLARAVRASAVGVPLFANLGAVQIARELGVDGARRAVDMLEADALILHLNPLQELLQPNGDRDWRGVRAAIGAAVEALDVPVIVKEVGFGLSGRVAMELQHLGVAALDVAGRGGTNFALVEMARSSEPVTAKIGPDFADWGLTTPEALQDIKAAGVTLPVIASGGVRHGLDAARAFALGAKLVAQAGPVLEAAMQSAEAVLAHFAAFEEALRYAIFLTGGRTPADLDMALWR